MLILRNLYQKEFGARKWDQRNRAVNALNQSHVQAAKAIKWAERYNKTAENVSKNFGGDVEKFLEANPRMKSTYQSGPHREALDNILGGQKVKEQASIQKHSASAKKQVEAAADQVHNYGKTRQSVRTAEGNTFNTQGRKVNVQEGKLGDVSVKTKNTTGDLKRQTSVTSATNKRRETQVKRVDNIKKHSTEILDRQGTAKTATNIKSKSANKAHDVLIEEGNKISKNNFFKRNKKALLIGTGVAAAAGAGAAAYKHFKNRKDNKE